MHEDPGRRCWAIGAQRGTQEGMVASKKEKAKEMWLVQAAQQSQKLALV